MSKILSYPEALLNRVSRIARAAGEITLEYFDESGYAGADEKADGSPVTKADHAAEEMIVAALREISADIPVVGEETHGLTPAAELEATLHAAEAFWLVDALDGTREFVAGGDEYTVNIALVRAGVPVLGVVYAPVRGELYAAHAELGALRWLEDTDSEKALRVRRLPREGSTVIVSKHRDYGTALDTLLQEIKVAKTIRRSSSLKICAVAAGKVDIYPGLGPTCEWDLAAGHAILRAAGGDIFDMSGHVMTYGHAARGFINPDFVAAAEFPFTPPA